MEILEEPSQNQPNCVPQQDLPQQRLSDGAEQRAVENLNISSGTFFNLYLIFLIFYLPYINVSMLF